MLAHGRSCFNFFNTTTLLVNTRGAENDCSLENMLQVDFLGHLPAQYSKTILVHKVKTLIRNVTANYQTSLAEVLCSLAR